MRCKLAALGPQVQALQKINLDGQIAIMAAMASIFLHPASVTAGRQGN